MDEPRNPKELLSLLNQKIQHFALAPGGIPYFTPEDIAGIVSKLANPNTRLYARIKYAQQTGFAEELAHCMRIEARTLSGIGGWRVPRPDWLLDLSRLAIYEDVDPQICTICKGASQRLINSKIVVCSGCNGSQRATLQDTDRARYMGLDYSNWHKKWKNRYHDLKGHTLYIWDGQLSHVFRESLPPHHAASAY